MSSQLGYEPNDFLKQINALVNNDIFDHFTLTQLKDKAQQHSQLNNVDGYLARTVLAGLEGNTEAIQTHYQQAITTFSEQHAFSLATYAKSLTPFGSFSKATDLMLKAYELSPTNLNYLDEAIYFSGLTGHFHQVSELLKTWNKQNREKPHRFSSITPKIIELMDDKQVTDHELSQLIDIALNLLRQHRLTIATSQIKISLPEEDNSQWFYYGIPLQQNLSVENMVALDFELADKMTEANLSATLSAYFVTLFERLES
jgi:hypothetical protein